MDIISIFGSMTTIAVSILVFILIFSVLIILHELGHYWAARFSGVGIEEFGFGLPPRVWGKETSKEIKLDGETRLEKMIWSINAIPFGGFVRLSGEDDPKNMQNYAFANRPLWGKILVVCGGVIMNFILGFVLLTIGYLVGMNPIHPSIEQKDQYVEEGFFAFKEGVLVQGETNIEKDLGFEPYDRILRINDRDVSDAQFFTIYLQNIYFSGFTEVDVMIERFNRKTKSFDEILIKVPVKKVALFITQNPKVIITEIIDESIAQKSHLEVGDTILEVDGVDVTSIEKFQELLRNYNPQNALRLTIDRNDKNLVFIISKEEDETLGVMISEGFSEGDQEKGKVYKGSFYAPIKPVQYDITRALIEAWNESIRFIGLSWEMVKDVVDKVISKHELPEQVGGPVSIAHTTNLLVEHGDISKILQFAAILSLSLAVLNIMPFPALDGGRLVFLLLELCLLIIRLPLVRFSFANKIPTTISPEVEKYFHVVGYVILLLFIIAVTWQDIARLMG